jgi:hypoxanthine phosphoribosyltransferase
MQEVQIKDKRFKLFISEEDIHNSISRIADQLSEEYRDKDPLFICILTGAFMFASEIVKRFNWDCEITFVRLKSYEGIQRKEEVRELQGFVEKIEGRNIIILEDIIESGATMAYLLEKIKKQNPASVRIASLFFKPGALQKNLQPDYVGFEIENDFIAGFGLDYEGYGRNLRQIYRLK